MAACDIQYWCVVGLLDTFTEGATVDVLKEETKTLFSSLDKDENGKIDQEELMQGFPQLDANAAGMLIAEADQDNDGSISFDELWAIIQQATGEKELMSGRDAPVVDTDPKEMQKTIIRLNAEVDWASQFVFKTCFVLACVHACKQACKRWALCDIRSTTTGTANSMLHMFSKQDQSFSPLMAGGETRCTHQLPEEGSCQSAHPRQGPGICRQPRRGCLHRGRLVIHTIIL